MLSYLLMYFFTWLLPDLSIYTPSRIDPFRFQAGGRIGGGDQTWLWFLGFILCCSICCYGCMFAFVGYVFSSFSVLSQGIGGEERLRNDLFCVGWDVKP